MDHGTKSAQGGGSDLIFTTQSFKKASTPIYKKISSNAISVMFNYLQNTKKASNTIGITDY